MIAHCINAVLGSQRIARSFVNTESSEIAAVAKEYHIDVHMRPEALASNTATTDEIVMEFLSHHSCDAVMLINPTAPFLKTSTIDVAIEHFIASGKPTLFTVNPMRKHCFFEGKAVNFNPNGPSPRTQDLQPVQEINFIISVFDTKAAIATYEQQGSFLYQNAMTFFEMDPEEALDIDYEHEFEYVNYIMRNLGV